MARHLDSMLLLRRSAKSRQEMRELPRLRKRKGMLESSSEMVAGFGLEIRRRAKRPRRHFAVFELAHSIPRPGRRLNLPRRLSVPRRSLRGQRHEAEPGFTHRSASAAPQAFDTPRVFAKRAARNKGRP